MERQKKRIEEQQARIEELRKSDDFKALEKANADLKAQVDSLKHTTDLFQKNKEGFQQEIDKLEREKKEREGAHKSEIAAMANRMRMTESGLLAEKLEAEIGSLRKTAAEAHDGIEKEREMRKAVEERVGIWLENEEKLKRDADKWRKRAALKYTYAAAACGVSAFLGYEAGIFSMDAISNAPLTAYSIVTLGAPALIASLIGGSCGLKEKCKDAFGGLLLGIVFWVGSMVPMVLSVDSELKEKDSQLAEVQKNFLKDCGDAPCRLVKDENGNYTVEIFARKYEGGKITFDFTKKDAPAFTHTQKIPLTGVPAP